MVPFLSADRGGIWTDPRGGFRTTTATTLLARDRLGVGPLF